MSWPPLTRTDSIKSANANAASPIDLNAFSQASSIDFVISLVNCPASLTPNKCSSSPCIASIITPNTLAAVVPKSISISPNALRTS